MPEFLYRSRLFVLCSQSTIVSISLGERERQRKTPHRKEVSQGFKVLEWDTSIFDLLVRIFIRSLSSLRCPFQVLPSLTLRCRTLNRSGPTQPFTSSVTLARDRLVRVRGSNKRILSFT